MSVLLTPSLPTPFDEFQCVVGRERTTLDSLPPSLETSPQGDVEALLPETSFPIRLPGCLNGLPWSDHLTLL